MYGCCYFVFLPILIAVFFQSTSKPAPVNLGHLYTKSYIFISETENCTPAMAKIWEATSETWPEVGSFPTLIDNSFFLIRLLEVADLQFCIFLEVTEG